MAPFSVTDLSFDERGGILELCICKEGKKMALQCTLLLGAWGLNRKKMWPC